MPDRFAELRLDRAVRGTGAHRQQGDFIIEIDESLHDDPVRPDPPALARGIPGGPDILFAPQNGLALARRGHDWLDQTGKADFAGRDAKLLQGIGETVGRSRQPQRFGGKPANALAVHGELRGARGRGNPRKALGLDFHKQVGGDGLDFRHDDVRALLLDERAQRDPVSHGDHVRPVRHLVARRVRVPVNRDHFNSQALQCDDHFLAQFARPEQHDPQRGCGKRGTDTGSVRDGAGTGGRHGENPDG